MVPEMENGFVVSTDITATKEEIRERREQKPLLYCQLIAKHPLRMFLICLAAHISMLIISVALITSGYDLVPVDFKTIPLELNDLPWRPRDLAWRYRESKPDFYARSPIDGYRANSDYNSNINLYYDGDGSNVFTQTGLETIRAIENRLTAVPRYMSTYCQLNVNLTGCEKPTSVIRYFDGTYSHISAVFNDPTFSNIAGVMYEAYTNNATKGGFQFFLGKSHEITSATAFSGITRSVIPLGFPLPRESTDIDGYGKFSAADMEPILEDAMQTNGIFSFSYYSGMLWTEYVFNRALQDVVFVVGSICFIFALILIHTKSLWITGFGIFSILMSFVTTNLIYRLVLDFRYIGFFHILTLFIVLGIGADDLFVFYDVWKNTGFEDYPSLAHRLSDACRRSGYSMLFTSITTSLAFFASATFPLLATRSFGVFSGLMVIVNFVSVVIYFPTVVVMHHTRYEHSTWPCGIMIKGTFGKFEPECKRTKSTRIAVVEHLISGKDVYMPKKNRSFVNNLPEDMTLNKNTNVKFAKTGQVFKTVITINQFGDTSSETRIANKSAFEKENELPFEKLNRRSSLDYAKNKGHDNTAFENGENMVFRVSKTSEQIIRTDQTVERCQIFKCQKQKSFMVRFFRDKYFQFITSNVCRVLILLTCVGVLSFLTFQASNLQPSSTGLRVLKDSHVYSVARDHSLYSFIESDSDRTVTVYVVWGMLPNDMDNCHFSMSECVGEKVWDPTFNPNTPEAQLAVKNLCDKMMNFTAEEAYKFRLKTDVTSGKYQIDCYINSLNEFLVSETVSTGINWGIPYNFTKSIAFMDNRTTYYNSSGFTPQYKDYLEIPISYWLSNKQTYQYTNDFFVFNRLIGEKTGNFSKSILSMPDKKYGNEIRYVGIQVNTTLNILSLSYSQGISVMAEWENFITAEMQQMPEGMKNGFQQTYMVWHWLVVQQALVENAIYGVIISVSFALPLFIIATGNFITGTLATLTICCSTICVIGVIPMCGWKLGVLESLNMCMVVGLTVDYVIHLAEGYTMSKKTERLLRVQDMLEEMAVSIFFGACSTLGASLFMFVAELSFFFQFGIFIFSTIAFSLFFSMTLFVSLMGIIGPQENTGNVMFFVKNIIRRCKLEQRVMGRR